MAYDQFQLPLRGEDLAPAHRFAPGIRLGRTLDPCGDCEALPPEEWRTQLEKGGGAVHYTGPQDVMDFNGMAAVMRMEELERHHGGTCI